MPQNRSSKHLLKNKQNILQIVFDTKRVGKILLTLSVVGTTSKFIIKQSITVAEDALSLKTKLISKQVNILSIVEVSFGFLPHL